jgi:hypothetical protein
MPIFSLKPSKNQSFFHKKRQKTVSFTRFLIQKRTKLRQYETGMRQYNVSLFPPLFVSPQTTIK